MGDHPTAKQLEKYSQRSLSLEVFDVIHQHVNSCVVCRDKCNALPGAEPNYANLLSALLPEPGDAPYHLSYEQVAAYVDRQPGDIDIQIAEGHLEVCAQCRDDVRSLREFKAASLAEAAPQPAKQAASGLGRRWRKLSWPAPGRLKKVAAIGAAAAALVLLALILVRFKTADRAERSLGSDNSNSANPQQLSAANSQANDQVANTHRGNSNSVPPEPLQASPESGPFSVALNDGGRRITLDQQGEVVGLENLSEALRQAVKAALTTQRLARPRSLAELNGRPSVLLSESGNGLPFRLLSPVGTVIQSNRPTFRWLPLTGASSYRVTVTDADLNEIAVSGSLTKLEWKIDKPLASGTIYSWQVTALKDGQPITSPVLPAPQAKFKVLEKSKADELSRARRTYSGLHLPLGVLYAQAGLLAESERELQLLLQANPGSRPVQNLLRSVQSLKKDGLRKHRHTRAQRSGLPGALLPENRITDARLEVNG